MVEVNANIEIALEIRENNSNRFTNHVVFRFERAENFVANTILFLASSNLLFVSTSQRRDRKASSMVLSREVVRA